MKWIIAAITVVLAALLAWVAFRDDVATPVGVVNDSNSGAATSQASAQSSIGGPTEGATKPQGIGGPNLRLRDSLTVAAAQKGTDSRSFAGMLTLAVQACQSDSEVLANERFKKDPQKAWAIQYIESACAGFDENQFKAAPSGWLVTTELEKGEQAATQEALQGLKNTENNVDVVLAGLYLIERGKLPHQQDYDLDNDQLAKALGLAAGLRTCAAMNACGAQSLLTAQVCAYNGCPPGTNYAQAMRNILSPKEYAAGLKMRDQLGAL